MKGKATKKHLKNQNFAFKNSKGVEYKVFFHKPNHKLYGSDCHGVCSNPKDKNPKILISPYLTNQSELNTIIHEMAHAFFWDKPEKDILAYANAVSRMLYNHQQWRKLADDRPKLRKKNK